MLRVKHMATKEPQRYEVKVFLYGIEPAIWRTFSVPESYSFAQLNDVIQKAMGWNNEKLHEFRHGKGKRLTDVIATPGPEFPEGDYFQDENDVTIQSFVGRRRTPVRLLYRYDFADEWVHELVFTKKCVNEDGDKALMIGGERACPPEDTGGAWAYNQTAQGITDWIVDDYDPEFFDASEVKL